MQIDYVNVEKDDIPTFENHIANTLKPVQEARVSDEIIAEWYIYKVAYPGTQDPTYNYVVVSISENLENFDDLSEQVLNQVSDLANAEMTTDFQKMLSPYRSELWRINNSVLPDDSSKVSKYFIMDYMNVHFGMEYAYQMMEDEVALS